MHKQILFILLVFTTVTAFAQTDATLIAEAKFAYEKSDCKAALDALKDISITGRQNPFYSFYKAKSFDCLKIQDSAIVYYNKYSLLYPANAEIIQRIAELNYELRKLNETKKLNAKNLTGNWYAIRNEDENHNSFFKDLIETRFNIIQNGDTVIIANKISGVNYFVGLKKDNIIEGYAFIYSKFHFKTDDGVDYFRFPDRNFEQRGYFYQGAKGLETAQTASGKKISYVVSQGYIVINDKGQLSINCMMPSYNIEQRYVSYDKEVSEYMLLNRELN